MRALAAVLAGLVFASTLAGCTPQRATPAQDSPSILPGTSATVDVASPAPSKAIQRPEFWKPVAATHLTAQATRGLQSTPWELLSAGENTLLIRYVSGGGCAHWRGIRVKETATSVEIWTAVRSQTGDPVCNMDLQLQASRIVLDHPLGARKLLHAPVSTHWKAYVNNF